MRSPLYRSSRRIRLRPEKARDRLCRSRCRSARETLRRRRPTTLRPTSAALCPRAKPNGTMSVGTPLTLADATGLMDRRIAADKYIVADADIATGDRIVCEGHLVADVAIMSDMRGHHKRRTPSFSSTSGPTKQYGPISTPSPICALSATRAVASIAAILSGIPRMNPETGPITSGPTFGGWYRHHPGRTYIVLFLKAVTAM
jgi:hypothetical protein